MMESKKRKKGILILGNALCILLFLLIAGQNGYGQTTTQSDSLKIAQQQNQTDNKNVHNGNAYGKGNSGNNPAGQAVKRVRAGRPDMSRARGARPPLIVRPSGSGVPKGIGKPRGVGNRGGR